MTLDEPTLAIRLDHGVPLVDDPSTSREVAAVLMRPCFAVLSRLSARRKDRWSKHTQTSIDLIADYLADPANDSISLDSGRRGEIRAGAQVENGARRRAPPMFAGLMMTYVALPFTASELDAVIDAVCDLARILAVGAGYVALEACYGNAHEVALGGFRPRERIGLSSRRRRERRARWWYDERVSSELAVVEWGTFLGAGHLSKVDLDDIRQSRAFARVVQAAPALAYLQVTDSPMDDLTDAFEDKLVVARRLLSPLLMDVSDVPIE